MAETHHQNASARLLRPPKRSWYDPRTWQRNIPLPPRKRIPSTVQLLQKTFGLLKKDWRTFFGITAVYGASVLIFVKSFSVGSVSSVQGTNILSSAFDRLGAMLSSASGGISAASGIYQIIVSTICSLALIWYFRQVLSGEKTGVKQSFYQGMRPLVPYLLVLANLCVNLVPIAISGYVISLTQTSFLAYGWETFLVWSIFVLLAIWSVRLLTHSLFALFVVTLPDMMPREAVRSAKKMVYRRRLVIWRKIITAAMFILVAGFILMLPFLFFLPALAPWVFFALTVTIATFAQALLYTIYREIL